MVTSTDVLQEAVNVVALSGSLREACRATGLAYTTLYDRVQRAKEKGILPNNAKPFDIPELPNPEAPIEDVIDAASKQFEQRYAARLAREWMPININIRGPYALAFVGDPHLDDDGCNWPLLRRDLTIINETPGLFGVGMGDYLNNWVGRLTRLYGAQNASQHTGWRMVDWFLHHVDWTLLLKGNHDMWSGSNDPLDWLFNGSASMAEWQAKVRFVNPDGHTVKLNAAHSFKGHSQWNPLHGPVKAAKFSGQADIYVQGHHHEWASFQTEDGNGKSYWALKARGYKYVDQYADVHGFDSQKHGASIIAIIDPERTGPSMVQCFADIAEGAALLKLKRADWEARQRAGQKKK